MKVHQSRLEDFLESIAAMARGTASSVILHPLLFALFYFYVGWEFSSSFTHWLSISTLTLLSVGRTFAWRTIPDLLRAALFMACVS